MIQTIAQWSGFVAIFIAIFAVVILYLTRSNIIDLLDRDVVMYDKNYESKKEALENAFNCLDLIALNGVEIKNNPQYMQKAREAYNGLICTVNAPKLYQEFYRMAIDLTASEYSIENIEAFKIACRGELITKRKRKSEGFKGTTSGALNSGINPMVSQPVPTPQPARPVQPRPAQPVKATRPPARPSQPVNPPKDNQ